MAELDFGVITIKNGKLLSENEKLGNFQGSMGQLWLPDIGLYFRRTYIGKIDKHNQDNGCLLKFNDLINSSYYDIYLDYKDRTNDTFEKPHYVKYWQYNNVSFKTRFVGYINKHLEQFDMDNYLDDVPRSIQIDVHPIYETSFKYKNNFYHVLHGYDIALDNYWHKSSKHIVNKFLRKYLTK